MGGGGGEVEGMGGENGGEIWLKCKIIKNFLKNQIFFVH